MKKYLTTFFTLIVCICFLTACGDSKYVGEWQLTGGHRGDTEVPIEKLEKLLGGSLKLYIEEDGTARLETPNTGSDPAKWEETDDGILLYEEGHKENGTTYTYQDGRLVHAFNGLEMILEKQ